MASRPEPPPNEDPRDMIRRAGRQAAAESLSEAFERMEQDDRADSQAGVDSGSVESTPGERNSTAWFDSTTGELSDLAGSSTPESSVLRDSSTLGEPSLSDASISRTGSITRNTLIATPRYRPTRRPPIAVIRVWDDGQGDSEAVRVRQTPFLIGRQEGDLIIGHERQMSRKHARIDRVQEGDNWVWKLTDLRSTNGTFLRVAKTALSDGVEVLLGGELVRFQESPSGSPPELVRVAPKEEEERARLIGVSHDIGTDAEQCLPFLLSSPYLDPLGFRVELSGGQWRVRDMGSTNHLWEAIDGKQELVDESMFQIGEQRFSFHLP